MAKNINDIKANSEKEKINLQGGKVHKTPSLKKNKNIIYKQKSPINEVKDLSGEEEHKYIYIRGKKFKKPKYLGNILRIAFGGFLILFVINAINIHFIGKEIQEDISQTAYEGYNYLLDAGKSATKIQFDNALVAFDKAIENFSEAEEEIWFINSDYTFYSQDSNIGQAVNSLLQGGKYFANAGKYFLDAVEEFNKIPIYFVTKNTPDSPQPPSLTESLKIGLEKTDQAIQQISLASEEMKKINEDTLPPELRSRVTYAKDTIEEIATTLESISSHFPAILKLLGDKHPHRYMIIFQNNNEIRPSGGFIGSYAILDINDGYIEKLETHDVYDLDGSFGGFIEPPDELKKFTANWRLRDSNFSPDFPLSAKKIRWFLEKEGGPTVDTVIAINQGLLKDMLEITGPIQVGNFGTLDSENYNLLLSFVIESKAWGTEDPKHILKVFVPAFKEAILKEENISKVSSKLYKAVQQKHIMMYSSDEDIQAFFDSLGVSGRVYQNKEDEDYLSVVNISIGGTKSEQFIEENIHHHTHIDKNGEIIDEVSIKRTHLWTDDIYYQWKRTLKKYGFDYLPDKVIDILGRGKNEVYVRIYVPYGSEIISSQGPEVETKYDKDLKKTYFFTTLEASAGETDEIWIKYSLPYKLEFDPTDTYKLFIEKQPGSRGSIFTKTVTSDEGINNLAIYPEETRINSNEVITYATNLVYDRYFSSIWIQEK